MRHGAVPDLLHEAFSNQVGHGRHSDHGVDACAGREEGCIRHIQVADLHSMRKGWQQLRHASFLAAGSEPGRLQATVLRQALSHCAQMCIHGSSGIHALAGGRQRSISLVQGDQPIDSSNSLEISCSFTSLVLMVGPIEVMSDDISSCVEALSSLMQALCKACQW